MTATALQTASDDEARAGVSTGETGAEGGRRPPSRIVRIAAWGTPIGVAALVLVVACLALPHEAWLAIPRPLPLADAWQVPLAQTTAWLADAQAAALRPMPFDAAATVALGAAVWSAVAAMLLARALATTLPAAASAGLALVAASAPLFAWQTASPFGGAPLALASAGLLWATTHRLAPAGGPVVSRLTTRPIVAAAMAVAALLLAAAGVDDVREATTRVRGDLGPVGSILLVISLTQWHIADARRRRVWTGAAVLLVVGTPLPAHLHAAIVLPWLWWSIGDGLARLIDWRGPRARHWAIAGLIAWMALNVARVPWGLQRQQAALVRTWADGVAALAEPRRPIVEDRSAAGRLVASLVRARTPRGTAPALVDVASARTALAAGHAPVVVDERGRDGLQWGGVGLDVLADDQGGASLTRILDALPRGTVVLAAISRDAAATLTPADWQALGRIGLRSPDAGASRAHVVAGVTRARIEAQEAVGADAATLGLQPGDPLGRTGTRSPVDARLSATATQVTMLLRDRPFLERAGMVLAFFTTRGDELGWRGGTSAAHLDGPPVGAGGVVRHEAMAALPCVDVGPTARGLAEVSGSGTLGLLWSRPGLSIEVRSPAGQAAPSPSLLGPEGMDADAQIRVTSDGGVARITSDSGKPVGLRVREVTPWLASADGPVRACAAWPLARRFDLRSAVLDLPLLPRFEPLYGRGWHDLEPRAGGGYFRWMAGPRSELRLPLRAPATVRVELDAQGVRPPLPTDVVRLVVNDHDAGALPLHPTRGIYTWEVAAQAWRADLNTVRLETTATLRPADQQPGGDPRQLGLLVYGWRFQPGSDQSRR